MRKKLLTMDVVLAREIKYYLEKENFRPGDKIPSERFLAEKFNVQRSTIRNALCILVQGKYIAPRERKGYFVAPARILISTRMFEQADIPDERKPYITGRLISFERILTDRQLAEKTMLPEQTPVYCVIKVYSENNVPLLIDCSYTPEEICPGLTETEVRQKGILKVLAEHLQAGIAKSNQKITLIHTNSHESHLLDVPPGSPMIKYMGLVYDTQGRLVNCFEKIMKMDDFAFIREAEKEKIWNLKKQA